MNIHESAEDYLEMILGLQESRKFVRAVDISVGLSVTKPSVSVAMRNLRENGYITIDSDNGGFLGDRNQHIAFQAVPIHAEVPIGDALLHALPGAPLDVFGEGAYFLLGEGCQKRKHQLTVVAQ